MPRDSAGNYTLPPGNPVASGEIISANWANTTMDDLGEALSASLDRYGRGGMLAPFSFADGTVSAPGAAWANEPTTGFFRNGYGDLQVTITGQQIQKWTPNKSYLWRDDGQGNVGWDEILTASSTGGDITFDSLFVKNDLYVNTDQFVVDSISGNSYFGSGNVGIGNSSPTAKLHLFDSDFRVTQTGVGNIGLNITRTAGTTADWYNYIPSGSDALAWYTADSERMRIDSSGNVGIGTDNPTGRLNVRFDSTETYTSASQGEQWLQVANNNTTSGVYSGMRFVATGSGSSSTVAVGCIDTGSGNGDFFFSTRRGGTLAERMRIDSSGNVGIGTSSPSYPLQVEMPSNGSFGASFRYTNGTNNPGLFFSTNESTKVSTIDASGSVGGILAFASTGTERMRIDSSGNVGIGTDSPSRLLTLSSTGATLLSLVSTDDNNCQLLFGDSASDTVGKIIYRHSNDSMAFETNAAERMRIDSSGDVTATGNITAYSDERLKSDVKTLDGSKVYAMRGVSFTKDGEDGSGVIAQELQKIAPELVNDSGEYLSVAYGNLVGYLIEAVKELKAEIEELKHGAT